MSDTTLAPSRFAVWLNAARPRTLPLALACIITGTGLAVADGALDLSLIHISEPTRPY